MCRQFRLRRRRWQGPTRAHPDESHAQCQPCHSNAPWPCLPPSITSGTAPQPRVPHSTGTYTPLAANSDSAPSVRQCAAPQGATSLRSAIPVRQSANRANVLSSTIHRDQDLRCPSSHHLVDHVPAVSIGVRCSPATPSLLLARCSRCP